MAASSSGRNPGQKSSRVSRAPGMPTVKPLGKAPPPLNAAGDRQANLRRGAGPTRGGTQSAVPAVAPAIRDATSPGTTIASRANSAGRAKKVAG